jgi:iron complex outermembrane receptor protein
MIKKRATNFRGRLQLFTALTFVGCLGAVAVAHAQSTSPEPVVVPGDGASSDLSSYQIEEVKIRYKKLLLREKDIPNAVSTLGPKDVQKENPTTGSIQTLLRYTPNVVAYSSQGGQADTTLAIRGVENDELAETLDGIPINSLRGDTGDYLSNNIGGPVTLNEIDGVTVYPGLAPPDHQGFGTVGGTIAYTTKQPTDARYEELEGGYGSFDTSHIGFTINTGDLGSGPDAPKALILYDQSQTAGFISNTNAQYHNFMFNGIKPYDNGLSKIGLVIIYNQGKGYELLDPVPTALQQQYGRNYNFPKSEGFYDQAGQFLTTILSDETYINQYAIFNGSLFFRHDSSSTDSYESAANVTSGGYLANIQSAYNFDGCVGADASGGGDTSGFFNYSPIAAFGSCAAGETDEYLISHSNVIGITPKLTLFAGAHNTIVIGGLLAKDTSSGNYEYLYGEDAASQHEENGYNEYLGGEGNGRSVYSAYLQDKITLLNDKLQITPGVKVDAAYTSVSQEEQDGAYDPAKLQNFTKIGEWYIGAAYNLPDHFVLFGSAGKGSLFAPTADYASGAASGLTGGTSAPSPEIVHLFEGGLRYDTPRLYLSADYYYQAIADGFGYYENFDANPPQVYDSNSGGYLFRGVEASGKFLITPELSVFANGSYDKTEYTKSFPGFDTLAQDQFGNGITGTPLSNVPDWTGTIGADYDSGPFSFGISGLYTGREYTTEDVNQPNPANPPQFAYGVPPYPGPGPAPANYGINPATGSEYESTSLNGATITNPTRLNPANFVVNLLLSYKVPLPNTYLQSLTLSLNVQNLLDEHYYTYVFQSENPMGGLYLPQNSFGSGYYGAPRSLTVDAVARF